MITKLAKTPSANMNRKFPQQTKARAAQVPKGTTSAKSSFFLNSQNSTSSLAHSNKRGGFLGSHGNNAIGNLDHSGGVGFKTQKSVKDSRGFTSPKVSMPSSSGLGHSKTA